MVKIEKFTIAPFSDGLDREAEPWLLPNEAFVKMENAFLRRGVLQKRYGYKQLAIGGEGTGVSCQSRVVTSQVVVTGESLGNTDGAGAAPRARRDTPAPTPSARRPRSGPAGARPRPPRRRSTR